MAVRAGAVGINLESLKPRPVSADPTGEMRLPTLNTGRLRLRTPEPRDTWWLEELLRDEDVRRHTLQPVRGRWRAWLEAPAHVWAPRRWAIDELEGDLWAPRGWISLGSLEEIDTLTVGFELRQRYWNRGIMTESLKRLMEYHFGEQPEEPLGAIVFEENYASRRVFEKAGFAETGLGDCQGHRSVFLHLDPREYTTHASLLARQDAV